MLPVSVAVVLLELIRVPPRTVPVLPMSKTIGSPVAWPLRSNLPMLLTLSQLYSVVAQAVLPKAVGLPSWIVPA